MKMSNEKLYIGFIIIGKMLSGVHVNAHLLPAYQKTTTSFVCGAGIQ